MKKVLRVSLIIICSLVILLMAGVVWLNTAMGENFVRRRAEAYLRGKLKTEVHIGKLGYGLPKYIVLGDVLLKDQAQDTLLSVGRLEVDLNMWSLIRKRVDVQHIILESGVINIYRNRPDTNFNFTYIITAFTGPKKEPTVKDTTKGGGFKIDIQGVKLSNIRLRYWDVTGGSELIAGFRSLDVKMKKFDLDSMFFHVKDLSMNGLQVAYVKDSSFLHVKDTSAPVRQPRFAADNVILQDVGAKYSDNLDKLRFQLALASLQTGINSLDLDNDIVNVDHFFLSKPEFILNLEASAKPPAIVDTIIKIDTTRGWTVNAGSVRITGAHYKMDNASDAPLKQGVDYAHLDVKNMSLSLDKFFYNGDTIKGGLNHLILDEKSGVVLEDLRTNFFYNNQGAVLKDLFLKTPNSLIRDYAEVHYPSLNKIKDHTDSIAVKLNFKTSIVGMSDVLQFAPDLVKQEIIRKYKNDRVKIEANINGYVGNLNIGKLSMAGFGSVVVLNGRLSGVPDPKHLNYNLNLATVRSTSGVVSCFLTADQLSSMRVPDNFSISGKLSGTTLDYTTHLAVLTSDGSANIDGFLFMSPGKGKEKYDLQVKAVGLNAGRILRKDSIMGKISALLTAKGKSFDPKLMDALFSGDIKSAAFRNYPYSAITFNGNISSQQGDILLASSDPNARMKLTGHADLSGKYAAAKVAMNIDSIDFKALGLYNDNLRIHGLINADFPELNPDYPRGEFRWNDPVIVVNGARYTPDSLKIISRPSEDTGQNIYAYLDIAEARVTGKTPLMKIPALFVDHINRHYEFSFIDTLKSKASKKFDTTVLSTEYNLSFLATVTDKPLLHGFLPGLTSFDSIHVDGTINNRSLVLNTTIPDLVYGSSKIKNGNIAVRGADSAFTYKVTADRLSYDKFDLWYADVHGNLEKDVLTTNISLADADKKERFALAALLQRKGDDQVLQLKPGLMLDYNTWQVAQPNGITFNKEGFYIQNLLISNKEESIKVNSEQPVANATIRADISNFSLGNITRAVSKNDTALAEGILSGNATYINAGPATKMTGDLTVHNLLVMGDSLGDLKMQVVQNDANTLDTKLNLQGHGNDIAVTGNYYLEPQNNNQFDLDLKLTSLNLQSFENMSQKQISHSKGNVKGDLKITGTAAAPMITGDLTTDKLTTTVNALNATYTMPHEQIVFSGSNVNFKNFTLQDSSGNKAVVNGDVDIKDIFSPSYDLRIKADKWHGIHSKKENNSAFYGDLVVTADVSVKGTATAPNIDGNISLLKGTDMTVVTPESNPELESNKGIVVFRNMHDTGIGKPLAVRKRDSTKQKANYSKGSTINVNVNIDKQAQLNLVLDQATGDFIRVRGVAALNTYILPDGTIGLVGNYELHEGAYQLNYNFIKRKFLIKDGSAILFAGDPVKDAKMDVTAVYQATIAPYDLVQKEVSDPLQLNYFKENLPFEIEMHMRGALLQPSLTFDIILPENKVYPLSSDQIELIRSKLSQLRSDTSQLNKQVFAVLLFGRFVADDPFNTVGSPSMAVTALQSVSRFVGEQLNQAAGKLVKGVDLSVDLATTSDYTTGDMRQRTDLNLAASKRLMNDRLKLTIGNDFELDGPQNNNSDQSNLIPSNLSADYMLTPDGRYTLQAYRKNYNEGVLQGYVTETGLDFIVSVDYNKFKNIFKNRHKNSKTTN